MPRPVLPLIALTLALSAAPVRAQMSLGHAKVAAVSASVSPAVAPKNGKGTLTVTLTVSPGFHVNAHKLTDPDLIPTDLSVSGAGGVKFGSVRYPAPRTMTVAGKPAAVYTGRTTFSVPFTVTGGAKPGRVPLLAALTYQGCNAAACFPPVTAPVKFTVSVR